jgi:RNA polymerase sigma-70 factor (ECF subfamily)
MLRVQAGDQQAFAELLERNHRSVLDLAYRYLRDRARAEDVAQEAFLKVYQARARYTPTAKFRTYLLRVAANLCISQLRRKRSVSLGGPGDDEAPEAADPDARQPGDQALTSELHQRVREAVERLPERQRVAILLNKFEGLDYQQVGEVLDLSPSATKSLLHRARMALKSGLESYLRGPAE